MESDHALAVDARTPTAADDNPVMVDDGRIRWFGSKWSRSAPIAQACDQAAATPTGVLCLFCHKRIAANESGVTMGNGDALPPPYQIPGADRCAGHFRCLLRAAGRYLARERTVPVRPHFRHTGD